MHAYLRRDLILGRGGILGGVFLAVVEPAPLLEEGRCSSLLLVPLLGVPNAAKDGGGRVDDEDDDDGIRSMNVHAARRLASKARSAAKLSLRL